MNTPRSDRAWAAAWTAYSALPHRQRQEEAARVYLRGGRFPGLSRHASIRLVESHNAATAEKERLMNEREAKASRQTRVVILAAFLVVVLIAAWYLLGGLATVLDLSDTVGLSVLTDRKAA